LKLDTERRRHKRFKYEALISHDISTNGNIYPGQMFNFSKGGLYFESDQAIYPGEDIYVALAIHAGSPSKETQLPSEVKVIWRLALEDSSCDYGYGGKFLSTYDAFTETGQVQKAPIEKKAKPGYEFRGENDSRKNTRKPYNQSCVFSYDSHEYQGIVTNICRGGAFILTQDNFVLGGRLTLVIPELKTRKAVKVTGWIVRISPEGIGVSFERRVSRERRSDLDRRTGSERRGRKRRKPRS
jgi:Tfp pilus assembly protein PilZ